MNRANLKILFNIIGLALGLALAIGLALKKPEAPQVWGYLSNGKALAQEMSIPATDPRIFTSTGGVEFDREGWLFALAAYGLHSFSGEAGLKAARIAFLLLAFGLCVFRAFQRGSRPFSGVLFSLLALYASLPVLGEGPAFLSLFLWALALGLMEGPFWESFFSRWIWLPVLAVAWVNLHSLAWMLLGLAGLWMAGEKATPEEAPAMASAGKWLFLGLLAICLLLNPSTYMSLPRGLSLLPGLGSPDANSPLFPGNFEASQPALLLMAVLFPLLVSSASLGSNPLPLRRDFLIYVFLASLSLLSRRMLPFFCFWAAPVAAGCLDRIVDALPDMVRASRWGLKVASLGAGFFLLPQAFHPARPDLKALEQPQETLDFFAKEDLSVNLVSEPAWADALAWKLQGQARMLATQRPLPSDLAADVQQILAVNKDWGPLLEKHGSDAAMLKIGTPLAKAMAYAQEWQPVAFDDYSVLYLKVQPSHEALIKTFAPRGLRPGDEENPLEARRLQQCEADLEARLAQAPAMGRLLYLRAALLLSQGREDKALEVLRQSLKLDPNFLPSYTWLGALLKKAGDKAGAAEVWGAALKISDDKAIKGYLKNLR